MPMQNRVAAMTATKNELVPAVISPIARRVIVANSNEVGILNGLGINAPRNTCRTYGEVNSLNLPNSVQSTSRLRKGAGLHPNIAKGIPQGLKPSLILLALYRR